MDQRQNDQPDRNIGSTDPDGLPAASIGTWLTQNAFAIAIIGLLVGVMIWNGVDLWIAAITLIGLDLVIFIHELGHFVAAKWCDVHVETFSIGFGPPVPGCQFRYGETTYMIALFPLGGYVKMVGEGSDDEADDDPRSFKNKTVGQRMLIISAGVVMNLILAAVCFVGAYMTTGVERTAGVIGTVEAGSPAWQKGLYPGGLLLKIGDTDNPYFDDVMPEVMHWPTGVPIPLTYQTFDGKEATDVRTQITPRKNEAAGRPMIGIAPAHIAKLRAPTRLKRPSYQANSAAAKADPPFQNGDRIVGTTDPDNPSQSKPLPPDPRNPGSGRTDFFELNRRLQRLASERVTIQVRRADQPDDTPPVSIAVPVAGHTNYGLRLAMGQIVAVRGDSPAAKAGIQPRDVDHPVGDVLVSLELPNDDGPNDRYVPTPVNAEEKPLDPVRLPAVLERWAARRQKGPKVVTLTVGRKKGHNEDARETFTLEWDDHCRYQHSAPYSPNSPMSLDGLGLAYTVGTSIAGVDDNSPAAKAGLQTNDVITGVQFYMSSRDGKPEALGWLDLEREQGAHALWAASEDQDVRQLGLRVTQANGGTVNVLLEGVEDASWPVADRGLVFDIDSRLQKADSLVQALALGTKRTGRLISQIYQTLLAFFSGRIEFKKNASGPIAIAVAAYNIAGESLALFSLFLGMISANLAVINFLPIPILDGGHMVYLIYEKVRGRPMPEQVRVAATFVGLILICSLMLFVIYLDLRNRL